MIKKILSFWLFLLVFPAFAETETYIDGASTCTQATLKSTSGNINLETVYEAKTIPITWESDGKTYSSGTCTYDGEITIPAAPKRAGYIFGGWRLQSTRCLVAAADVTNNGSVYAGKGLNGETVGGAALSTYGISQNGEWGISWSNGDKMTGIASCQPNIPADILYIENNRSDILSGNKDINVAIAEYTALAGATKGALLAQLFSDYSSGKMTLSELYIAVMKDLYTIPDADYTTSGTGIYCLCKANTYTESGMPQCSLANAPWTFWLYYKDAAGCAEDCVKTCGHDIMDTIRLRTAVIGHNVAAASNDSGNGGNSGGGNGLEQCSAGLIDNSTDGDDYVCLDLPGGDKHYGCSGWGYDVNAATYGVTTAGNWAVIFKGYVVSGESVCASNGGKSQGDTGTPVIDEKGDNPYCWCHATIYDDGKNQCSLSSPSWGFHYDFGSAAECAIFCAESCASNVRYLSGFRAALFGSFGK